MAESVHALLVAPSDVTVWGLLPQERLRRQLRQAGVKDVAAEDSLAEFDGTALVIRADYVYDDRIVGALVGAPGVALRADGEVLAAHVPADRAADAVRVVRGDAPESEMPGVVAKRPVELCSGYTTKLRKLEPPLVLRVTEDRKDEIEWRLFGGSYKGVTDFVTRFLWPRPAFLVTRLCVRAGIRPNHVTAASLLLVILVTWLFAGGHYSAGLAAAWLMTFLDTVDGKLARVTVTSSSFGHVFDHAIDLVHPPFWYIAWGLGIGAASTPLPGVSLTTALAAIVVAYIAGRVIEGLFSLFLGPFELFCWRPIDSYFRLIMARRNPNLVLLTGFWLGGRPDWGLVAVMLWTVWSSAFLLVRLVQAAVYRMRVGPLVSWLADPSLLVAPPRYARPFVAPAAEEGP